MFKQRGYVLLGFIFFATTTLLAQPKAISRSLGKVNLTSVSKLITENKTRPEIKQAWIAYLINHQIEQYDEVINLANQTIQSAYKEGNKSLSQKLAMVEYLTALRLAHTQEINLAYQVKLGIINNEKIGTKGFKLEPTIQSLNKRDLLKEGEATILSNERLGLMQMAQSILNPKNTHEVNGNTTPLNGKNERKANHKPLFELRDVIFSKGSANKNTPELEAYISELRVSFTTVEYAYKRATTELRNAVLKHETTEGSMLETSQMLKDSGASEINK